MWSALTMDIGDTDVVGRACVFLRDLVDQVVYGRHIAV